MTRPTVVLIMADQHRADVMGCAGDGFVSTPNLDRLAAEGER
jgi:arylsulfatase A-like enzyme